VGALPGPAAPDRSITRRPAQLTTPGRGNWRSQALQQWNGTGALGDENSDVENLAHNIQIGTPRSQIQQSSPKRQIGGSARGYHRAVVSLAALRAVSVHHARGMAATAESCSGGSPQGSLPYPSRSEHGSDLVDWCAWQDLNPRPAA
jgi:hypothetical protein